MAGPTLFQVRRTSVADREANTTYLPTPGEIGVNLTDGRMWVANTTAAFEIGANTKNSRVSNSLFIGNSTVNTTANSSQINVATLQASVGVFVGANVDITPTDFFIGNATANIFANSILLKVANSTGIANLQPTQLIIGPSTINSTVIAVGANVFMNATTILVGNSTSNVLIGNNIVDIGNTSVNLVANSIALKISNSTVNTAHPLPTAAQYGGAYYLHANGTWQTVSASVSAGGANTHVQYNDSTALNGSAAFTFDEVSNTVAIGNAAFFGNSSVNNTINSVSVAINLSATANLTSNSLIVQVANSSGTANLTATSLNIANSTTSAAMHLDSFDIITSSTNNISSPAANGLSYFSKYKAGRMLPVSIGASGWDTPFQPHLLHNPSGCMLPNPGATTVSVLRLVSANTVAFTARSPTNANTFMSMLRIGQTTGATAGTSCSWRNNAQLYWLGNAAGRGGFYVVSRFGVSIVAAQGRAFVGLVATTSALANSNPSTLFTQIGFGFDSAQTTWRVMTANTSVANTIDTTMDCTTGNTYWYEGVLFSAPNSQQVGWQLVNLTNGNVAFGTCNSACLPANNTFLAWQAWCNNGSTAGAEAFDWGGVTIETNL